VADPGLGAQYERGVPYAFRYDRGSIPDDDVIQADLELKLCALRRLYDAEGANPPSGEPGESTLARAWLT
jgi:hypothetical protein